MNQALKDIKQAGILLFKNKYMSVRTRMLDRFYLRKQNHSIIIKINKSTKATSFA
jgi:hypothetical protein